MVTRQFKINFEKNNNLYNHYIQQYTINLEKAQFIGRYLLHDNEMTSHLLYLPKRSKVGKANKNATSLTLSLTLHFVFTAKIGFKIPYF